MNCGIDQSYVNIAGEDGNIEPFEDAPRLNSSLTLRLKRKYTAASKHRKGQYVLLFFLGKQGIMPRKPDTSHCVIIPPHRNRWPNAAKSSKSSYIYSLEAISCACVCPNVHYA